MAKSGTLTATKVEALAPRQERYVEWDRGGVVGFGVRVSVEGVKTFIFKYRLRTGQVRWKTIGRVGVFTVEEARNRARRDAGLVADGKDPQAERDAAKHVATVNDVCDAFLADHVKARRKKSTQRSYTELINNHLRPHFGTSPITAITTQAMLKRHTALRATPYQANRLLAVVSKLANWAIQAGYLDHGHVNPTTGIEKYKEHKRERYVTPEENLRIGCALRVAERREVMSPGAILAIKLLMLTGARLSEILTLKWEYLDLARGVMNLPDSKSGAKIIMLDPYAVDLLTHAPHFSGSPYVFPGEARDANKKFKGHRADLKTPWRWVRTRAKLTGVTIHTLRHSYASVAVSSGQSLAMIGALLGHKQPTTTARYAHLMLDPLRAASTATSATIAAAFDRPRKTDRGSDELPMIAN